MLLWAMPSFAEEKITAFDVLLEVEADGDVQVTETISVHAEGDQIRRGIFRDIPFQHPQDVTPKELLRDGSPSPWFTETFNNGLRVNFGDNSLLSYGAHTYRLTYTMSNAVRFFKDYDELYWNVTGNYWDFPIESASVTVVLPPGAEAFDERISFYTGRVGSKEQNARRRGLTVRTAGPLRAREGLTVAVPFQKGFVTPSVSFKADGRRQWAMRLLLILVPILAAWYGWWAWKKVGKDPASRVIRRFDPPPGVSPALARYLTRMGYDVKTLAVTLTSLAMKGAVRITQNGSHFTVDRQTYSSASDLPEEEYAAFRQLPATLVLDGKYSAEAEKIGKLIRVSLDAQNRKRLFSRNIVWTLPVWAAAIGIMWYLVELSGGEAKMVWWGPVLVLSFGAHALAVRSWWGRLLMGLFILFFASVFFAILGVDILQTLHLYPLPFAALLAVVTVGVVLAFVIGAYTPRGREMMDGVEGFKEYLSVAESGRVLASTSTEPENIFCDYLPYALALDVENKWIRSFEMVLARTQWEPVVRRRGFVLGATGTLAGFSASLTLMSKSFSAGATPPSSRSSGSGGGGFSGGGFGGGGGGGR